MHHVYIAVHRKKTYHNEHATIMYTL